MERINLLFHLKAALNCIIDKSVGTGLAPLTEEDEDIQKFLILLELLFYHGWNKNGNLLGNI